MLNEQELSQKFNDMSHEELVRYAVQLQMANQNFMEQLQLIRAGKFGHTSEKLAELQQQGSGLFQLDYTYDR